MDTIDIPADKVPAGLLGCQQILKRAKEVKKVEPVVAYWCCFYAAQKALKVQDRSKEDTMFLMSLLDVLEAADMEDDEAIHTEAAGAAYIQNFALKVFMSADNDDRNGVTGKGTIRKFVVAGQFIEVLSCFENGMTEEKLQYARWKAADHAKALREGRTPTPGPPIPDEPIPSPSSEPPTLPSLPTDSPSSSSRQPNLSSPNLQPSTTLAPSPRPSPLSRNHTLPNIDTSLPTPPSDSLGLGLGWGPGVAAGDSGGRTPQRTSSTASGAWSTVATPGLPDDELDESKRFPGTPSGIGMDNGSRGAGGGPELRNTGSGSASGESTGSGSATPVNSVAQLGIQGASPDPGLDTNARRENDSDDLVKSPGGTERKNVRFMGPDGAPLSPAHTHFTVDSYDAPVAPPPTVFGTGDDEADGSGRVNSVARGRAGVSAPSTSTPGTARPGGGMTNGSAGGATNTGLHKPSAPPASTRPSTGPGSGPIIVSPPPSAPPLHSINSNPGEAGSPAPFRSAATTPATASASAFASATAAATPLAKPGRKTIEACQKHARWAISALEFDDPETARAELRKALALLGG